MWVAWLILVSSFTFSPFHFLWREDRSSEVRAVISAEGLLRIDANECVLLIFQHCALQSEGVFLDFTFCSCLFSWKLQVYFYFETLPKIVNYLKMDFFSPLNELSWQFQVSSSVIFIAAGGIHRINIEQMSCDSFLCVLGKRRNKGMNSSHVNSGIQRRCQS